MDWHSWLSRSNLEPSLVIEFGLVFCRNELQKEDMMYFNHEFLQSLGISVAKHRLEILSLVNKELGRTPTPSNALKVGMFILAFKKKTKKFFTKWVSLSYKNSAPIDSKKMSGKLRRLNSAKEHKVDKSPTTTSKTVTKSGPIDRRMVEQMMITDKWSISLSGPLDMKIYQEKVLMSTNLPRAVERHGRHTDGKWRKTFDDDGNNNLSNYRPWQGRSPSPLFTYNHGINEEYSPWSMMFQDLKPT